MMERLHKNKVKMSCFLGYNCSVYLKENKEVRQEERHILNKPWCYLNPNFIEPSCLKHAVCKLTIQLIFVYYRINQGRTGL
jgi:hypothetical protein